MASVIDEWYEKQYIPSYWSKKHLDRESTLQHFLGVCTKESENVRNLQMCDLNVSYGETKRQKMDIFYPNRSKVGLPGFPILIYIHGGYWQEGDKDLYSFIAMPFTKRGFIVVVVGYDLAPNVTLQEIINQITKAIQVMQNLHGNVPIILIGHSAGAYLAAAISTANHNIISSPAAYILVSGVYYLRPLIKTSLNQALKLNDTTVKELSVMHTLEFSDEKKVCIFVGEDESPEMKKQSQSLYEKLSNKYVQENNLKFFIVEGEDHFSIIENILDEKFILTEFILKIAKDLIKD